MGSGTLSSNQLSGDPDAVGLDSNLMSHTLIKENLNTRKRQFTYS